MFAPPLVKQPSKPAGHLRPLALPERARCRPFHPQQREPGTASVAAESATWDFSGVPVSHSREALRFERLSGLPVPRPPGFIQPKLKIGAVDDPLEHEAEIVADRVMRMPLGPATLSVAPRRADRKCAECEEDGTLQKESAAAHGTIDAHPAVHQALHSPGQPLDATARAFFEPRFERDFSQVRVHSGAAAAQSARDLNAHAYTVGRHIVFGPGQFSPHSDHGRKLIAHELAHVVQQSGPASSTRAESEDKDAVRATVASPAVEMLQRSPDEKSCAIHETILAYQAKPGQERCITEEDPEFKRNYIDNNIVLATGLAVPDTTWENIDHDRVPVIMLTYKDGRTLHLFVTDIPLVLRAGRVARGKQAVSGLRLLARYEKRTDGFIYPIRSGAKTDWVSYGDANNIVSLRAGLHEQIEELKLLFVLIETGAAFAQNIAALGGIASMVGRPGSLFEPIPRRKKAGAPAGKTSSKAKTTRTPPPDDESVAAKPREQAPASAKQKLAEVPAKGKHTVRISKGGIVEFCSDPCTNISLVYRETLDQNPPLAKEFRDIQTRARQAEQMIESGNPASARKGERLAKKAAADAVRLQNKLAKTGITRNGVRYRPEPDLLGEGRHGLGWKDSAAIKRAKDTGNPQGRFNGPEDIQFAAEHAARLGPGNETRAPYIELPANTRSVVFMPDGTTRPATHLYVKVRADGSFHAYPL